MPDDPLKKWERRATKAAPSDAQQGGELAADNQVSEITGGGDTDKQPTRYRIHCVEFRPLTDLWSWSAYAQLIDMLADGENPSFIALLFFHQLVIIRGRNLKAIVAGLRMRTQWVIEQQATPPANRNAEYVESIEFITENVTAYFTQLRQTEKKSPKEKRAHRENASEEVA